MITIKIFAFLGLGYLMIGIFNYKIEWVDKLYLKIWGFEPPTRKETIRLGVNCIVIEILIDFFINYLI
jgi:hypothetical protein